MLVAFVVTDGGMEYTTPFHLSNEMMWYVPHHSIRGKAGALTTTKCYGRSTNQPGSKSVPNLEMTEVFLEISIKVIDEVGRLQKPLYGPPILYFIFQTCIISKCLQ